VVPGLVRLGGLDYFALLRLTVNAPPATPRKPTLQRALEVLQQGPTTPRALAQALKCHPSTAQNLLTRLCREGRARREGTRQKGYTYYATEGEPAPCSVSAPSKR